MPFLALRLSLASCAQMLMGGGKTTVVGPLLALLLGGDSLVVQTMPPALLEQSMATLRATFSSIVRKRVFTLFADRSSPLTFSIADRLEAACKQRGVVLCTATTLKAISLKLLELMHQLQLSSMAEAGDVKMAVYVRPSAGFDVRACVRVITIFKSSTLIMDEVDLLLHPLRSELNFPIGDKVCAMPV